jgi:hypothetical protein
MVRRSRKRKHHLQRARQARYEARVRAGIMLCPITIGVNELDTLIRLHWLPNAPVITTQQVSTAIEQLLRQL